MLLFSCPGSLSSNSQSVACSGPPSGEIRPFNAVKSIRGRLELRLGKRPKIRKLRDLMAFVVSGGHPSRFHHVVKPLGQGAGAGKEALL